MKLNVLMLMFVMLIGQVVNAQNDAYIGNPTEYFGTPSPTGMFEHSIVTTHTATFYYETTTDYNSYSDWALTSTFTLLYHSCYNDYILDTASGAWPDTLDGQSTLWSAANNDWDRSSSFLSTSHCTMTSSPADIRSNRLSMYDAETNQFSHYLYQIDFTFKISHTFTPE